MPKTNVIIIGIGSGYSYGNQGPSHHSVEDIGIMSALPNMVVFSPCDPWEVNKGLAALIKHGGPAYVRLGKSGEATLHKDNDTFKFGRWNYLCDGKDVSIIATGGIASTCLRVAELLEHDGISASVISAHTLKPADESTIKAVTAKLKYLFTVEQNSPWGGLGSIVGYILAKECIHLKGFYSFTFPDSFHEIAGDSEYLEEIDGLNAKTIYRRIKSIYRNKGGRKHAYR